MVTRPGPLHCFGLPGRVAGLLLVLRGLARRVQGVDLTGVVGQDAAAFELEGGRHVAVLHGEGRIDDAVAADRLRARHRLVGAGDRLLQGLAYLGQGRCLRRVHDGQAVG